MSDRRRIATSASVSAAAILALLVGTACADAQAPAAATPASTAPARSSTSARLVAIGPRVAGTPGAAKARDYITAQLKAARPHGRGAAVRRPDAARPAEDGQPARDAARRCRQAQDRPAIIAGHYDTKLFREFTFVGANDGGSSAAFLIELARVLKGREQRAADRAALPRRRGSGRRLEHGQRPHLRQPLLRRGGARKAGTLKDDPRAHPRRHDWRPRPADHARAELDAVADRHHLGARREP